MLMVRRTYMQIGVFTLLTALVWTGVSVFLAITKTEIENADKDILSPINATIDDATLQKLSERITLTQIQSETLATQQASESDAVTINEVTTAEIPVAEETSTVSTNSTQLEQGEL